MLNGESPRKEGMDESWIYTLAGVLYHSRDWHRDLQNRFEIHSAVVAAFKIAKCCDWHRLVLEWPHTSMDDPKQLAYVRSEDKAAPEKNTKTAVGKYIKRHFPTMKDDVLRDLVYKHTSSGCKFVRTTAEMIDAVQNGPSSCMQDSWSRHPYEVYDPELGWSMAIRVNDDGDIVARALVHDGVYVRSYGNGGNDCELEAWLENRGAKRGYKWPDGTELKRIDYHNDCGFLAPYIDGEGKRVSVGRDTLVIDSDGDYECCCTGGDADGGGEECPDCGGRTDEDDMCYLGDRFDRLVCRSCLENGYTYVNEGRRRDGYYVSNDDAVEVNGEWYDRENLPDDIICLEDGDYCHMDDAVECVETGGWYHHDDRDIVQLESGEYCRRDYAWKCYESGVWYPDSVDYVEVDGKKYHPDNAPETDEDEIDEPEDHGKKPRHDYEKPDGAIANEAQAILDLVVDEGPHKWQHIIDAMARGETVQAKWLPEFMENDRWTDMAPGTGPVGHSDLLEWRIKHKWQHIIDARDEGKAIELRWHPTENWQDMWPYFDFENGCTSSRLEFRVKAEQLEGEAA